MTLLRSCHLYVDELDSTPDVSGSRATLFPLHHAHPTLPSPPLQSHWIWSLESDGLNILPLEQPAFKACLCSASQTCTHWLRGEAVERNSVLSEAISSRTSRLKTIVKEKTLLHFQREILWAFRIWHPLWILPPYRRRGVFLVPGLHFKEGSLHGIMFWGMWRCFRHTSRLIEEGTMRNWSTDAENAEAMVDGKHSPHRLSERNSLASSIIAPIIWLFVLRSWKLSCAGEILSMEQ